MKFTGCNLSVRHKCTAGVNNKHLKIKVYNITELGKPPFLFHVIKPKDVCHHNKVHTYKYEVISEKPPSSTITFLINLKHKEISSGTLYLVLNYVIYHTVCYVTQKSYRGIRVHCYRFNATGSSPRQNLVRNLQNFSLYHTTIQ